VIDALDFPDLLGVDKDEVNVNPEVLRWYVEKIVGQLCNSGDDEQHGSTVLCDINALQALSRRVHLGKFVAESKYLVSPEEYSSMVQNGDVVGILKVMAYKYALMFCMSLPSLA
jgi:chorismate mutase